jgi:hypothetical protein
MSTTAIETARCYMGVFGRYGICQYIRSDNGSAFVNETIKHLTALLHITPKYSIAYRAQSNGIIERANAEITRHLRVLCMEFSASENWSDYLPMVARIINSSVNPDTGISPAMLVFGNRVQLDRGILLPFSDVSHATTEVEYVNDLYKVQTALIERHQIHLAEMVDARVKDNIAALDVDIFVPGEYVMMSYVDRAPTKLHMKWRGPLRVMSGLHGVYTCMDLCTHQFMEVHQDRLKKFIVGTGVDPQVVAAQGAHEFVVESLKQHRFTAAKESIHSIEFLVHWEGYEDSEDTWEPWDNVKKCSAVDSYFTLYPALRKKLRIVLSKKS